MSVFRNAVSRLYFCVMIEHNDQQIQDSVLKLWDSYKSGVPTAPIRDIIGDSDIDKAYKIQEKLIERHYQDGKTRSGVKIGLTSPAVQTQLGVDQPDFGILFHETDISKTGEVSYNELMQPKVEAEMAFIIGDDITQPMGSIEELQHKLESVHASIEIVGSRVADWNIKITDTVADNASASHYILSNQAVRMEDVNFINAKMELYEEGVLKSTGNGSACMGNPLNAVLWLCNTFINKGVSLTKGEVILSGALGPMVPCIPGARYNASIEGLGEVGFQIV